MKKGDSRNAILGISAYYHDSAAALLVDGKIIAASQEERFSRKKHDSRFPKYAVEYALSEGGLSLSDVDLIVFYEKPYLKFERLLETAHNFAPRGIRNFIAAMPVWIKEKLFMKTMIKRELEKFCAGKKIPPLYFSEHHLSHAASAFYPSPFEEAAILTIDGVGEWATTTIGFGKSKEISIIKESRFPHSLGLLYSAFTYYCGFKVNSGEYKLMGLAPYGRKGSESAERLKKLILTELVSLKKDGSLLLNMDFFDFATGLRMCRDKKWEELFGFPSRRPEEKLSQNYMDLALAIQEITEEAMVSLAKTAKELTGAENLVIAGGVALNCVANAKILESGVFKDIWVQPAAGDAGGALGAALVGYHIFCGKERLTEKNPDAMQGSYLGPEFSDIDIKRVINKYNASFEKFDSFNDLCETVAIHLARGAVVGWFQGRMEWGPRALGNRSILADPREPEMQKRLNLKIKFREGFRPFAPSVLIEDAEEYFENVYPSPYMLLVLPLKKERRKPLAAIGLPLDKRLYASRSDIPAVTHLDYSARVQTVSRKDNKRYWELINAFKKKTGCSVVINTSFNVRGEPIVCSPEEAYCCFMATDMDMLVMENFLFEKQKQPGKKEDFQEKYELD